MYQRKNFAYGIVATAPSPASSGTSLVLTAGEGARFPNTSGGTYVCVVKAPGVPATPDNAEVVLVTTHDPAGDTFTITRTQESSGARTVLAGDEFYLSPTSAVWDSIFASPTFTGTVILPKLVEIQDTTGDHQYVLAVSELTADRTITLPLLTGNDEFVFKDHPVTETNKTFTSPVINTGISGSAIATGTEVAAGTDNTKAVTPKSIGDAGLNTRLKSKVLVFTRDAAATDADVSYTGVGFPPTALQAVMCVAGNTRISISYSDSAKSEQGILMTANNVWAALNDTFINFSDGASAAQYCEVKTLDSDGFTLSWHKFGSPTGTMSCRVLCLG